MTLYVIGFVIVFLLILASGLPVGFALGFLGLGLMTFYQDFGMAMGMGVEKAYTALDSSVLVAIPLFVLAAAFISASGMGKRLFDSAKAYLGNLRGGLGSATVVSSGVFAAMTGSSFISASTMGLIAIPELRKAKYTDSMISASIVSGGSLGSVIPPSIVMIIYAFLTDESVGKLFMAGIIPGLLLIIFYCAALAVFYKERSADEEVLEPVQGIGIPQVAAAQSKEEDDDKVMGKFEALVEGFWGLMAPVIILGGIYIGIFTASEAAAVAVVYCILIGFFIYRTLNLKVVWEVAMNSACVSSMIAMVIVGGAILAQVAVLGRIPQQILEAIIASNFNPLLLLILVNLLLFFLGMFLESIALMYLAIPLLYPVVVHMQWDNVWFAVLMLINVNLGLITPPMGGVLFIVSQIGGIHLNTVIKGAMLPLVIMIFLIVLLIVFPPIATWLPSQM